MLSLEKLAMDLYSTKSDKYPEVKYVLGEALRKLARLRNECGNEESECDSEGKKKKMNFTEDDGCSPGYVNCNGVCLPECDRIYEY